MNAVFEKFSGRVTSRDSRICVEHERDHVVVGLITFGNHLHIPVAHIKQANGAYKAVWFGGPDNQPSAETEYDDQAKLLIEIEQAILIRDTNHP